MSGLWIGDESSNFNVGEAGFLVCISHDMKGWERRELREHPAKTNVSNRERLIGWCGTYNDVACYAEGLGVVERVARNGRAYIRKVDHASAEGRAILESLGYPDLTD